MNANYYLATPLLLVIGAGLRWTSCQCLERTDQLGQEEPPFPALFMHPVDLAPISPRRVRIVTEVIGGGYKRVHEEYLDMDLGRAAYVALEEPATTGEAQEQAQQVLLSWARTNELFRYKPYTCETLESNFTFKGDDYLSIRHRPRIKKKLRKTRRLRIFGLAALWLIAEESDKSYKRSDIEYINGQNAYRMSHTWTFEAKLLKATIAMTFSVTRRSKSALEEDIASGSLAGLNLESAELRRDGRLSRMFNILSIEYELSAAAYQTFLELPVGYGCRPKLANVDESEQEDEERRRVDNGIEHENEFWSRFLWTSARVELEVTGTRIEGNERSTDTRYVELGHLPMKAASKEYDLMLIKIKGREMESKVVLNSLYNVKYEMDLQRASCKISHFGKDEQADGPTLKFANGLELSLGRDQLKRIFSLDTDFTFIKSSASEYDATGKQVARHYSERPLTDWADGLVAREILTLVTEHVQGRELSLRLASITIWVLDAATMSKLSQIFHVNIVLQEGPLSSWPDVGRHFDVSQRCYLDDERMKAGTDYAWVEFFFPLTSKQMDAMSEGSVGSIAASDTLAPDDNEQLRRSIHERLVSQYELTSFRNPRLELMHADEGLVVRALLLDVPPLEALYELHEATTILLAPDTPADRTLVAPDVRHCARLCLMYDCKSLTFCSGSRACLVGSLPLAAGRPGANGQAHQASQANQNCVTLSAPDGAADEWARSTSRLTSTLSLIAHQDYDTLAVPTAPDELTMARDESDEISEAEYKRIMANYLKSVLEFISDGHNKTLPLVLALTLNGRFMLLLPTKFSIENNPLDELRLDSAPDLMEDIARMVSFFQEGQSMSRYRLNSFRGELRDSTRFFTEIAYDQCALACLEADCGTFSYCPARKECILTPLKTIKDGWTQKLVEDDSECFIAQRDYSRNFEKFVDVKLAKGAYRTGAAASVNDCAMECLHDKARHCMSFSFCPRATNSEHSPTSICGLYEVRHPESIFSQPGGSDNQELAGEAAPDGAVKCDHYERSALAEFNTIEAHQFDPKLLEGMKTYEHAGAEMTPMDCADVCLNKLATCSAFQFCFDVSAQTRQLECLMLEGRPTVGIQVDLVIDDNSSLPIDASKWLQHNANCRIFALRPDTVQAHLRELALGKTVGLGASERASKRRLGVRMSWLGCMALFISAAMVSFVLGMAATYAHERSAYVRSQVDRVRYYVGGRIGSCSSLSEKLSTK